MGFALPKSMSRLPLIHIPNGLYSVVSKCNNDEFLFDADVKFDLYLQHLLECKKIFGFTLYDIVCMSNHVHELYRVPDKVTISEILQRVKGKFSQKFNKKFGRKNHFWRNKPFYRIIEDEGYAYNTMNYFHWNPVKAGMVQKPEDWPYSGYRFHILGEKTSPLGKLLDPLPNSHLKDNILNMALAVQKAFTRPRQRFIGSETYQKQMKRKYGSK